ncbi:PPOX class F420-dependent oxidoreductase [Mycobacterium sp. 1165196.3]|uniref:TIGR03667 family PPOX class F420-dependent oxidoreductase n=1 Tax=unclassified Mycobacterium TaxID=2642494 RepID=UPI0007FC7AA2|nr:MULTISPECIES: TIGR03667 family PPOX class F420-dependent oxidoreductase [unclassified Mycobacterium]OBJ01002.1 PPOX class F420-dependent oxidoreductase [Mycobacterium sp. 1482292.6]OBJ98175.1 PPOX class F420-dependent oxidoreductase [Mycobacterium sp. 1245852.3]OBK32265.1 PPOX class F420-dependent oxidoreductase [Mycobacterium sp. 1165196.3]OBK93854.1 PPOX class F420-dependent oxidoreductase [Mycobacterium sp. 1245499.0]
MSVELTQEVSNRLRSDNFGWLTTVAKSGQPVPRLVWFYFDGTKLTVYTLPQAAKVAHVKAHPQVSLNLDSDGSGGGIIVIGGTATIDATDVNCRNDEPYWAKYRELAEQLESNEGMSMDAFSTRLAITPSRVWTTPGG